MSVAFNRLRLINLACGLLLILLATSGQSSTLIDAVIEREGMALQVELRGLEPTENASATSGDSVRLRLSTRRLADGQPLSGLAPGVWLDRDVSVLSGAVPVCGQRVAGLLGGDLMARPLLDLTGYFMLTLDAEGSLSVIDPSVDFAGRTSLYKTVPLGGVPFDWVLLDDHTLAFVAVPELSEVVVIDLQSFDIVARIDTDLAPTRLALSADQRLLWVGTRRYDNASSENSEQSTAEESVLIIDTFNHELLARVPVPEGHHEFAFDDSYRQAWISSRDTGMLIRIDATDFTVKSQIALGGQPLSLVHVPDQDLLWVAEAQAGVLIGLDPDGQIVARRSFRPGIGPVRLAPDGKTLVLLNPTEHQVHVLDAGTGRVLQDVTVSGRPYDLAFTESYLYVRTLDSPQLALFDLASLRASAVPQAIPAGQQAMSSFASLPIASSLAPTLARTGMFFGSPAERTLYHFMEGMNAPDRSIRTFGHTPIAVTTALRGLREVAPGRYEAVFDLPVAGQLVLALALDTPVLRECIPFDVARKPEPAKDTESPVEWLEDSLITAGVDEPVTVRFKGKMRGKQDPRVLLVGGAGGAEIVWQANRSAQSPDDFSASGTLDKPGGYYIYLQFDGETRPAMGQVPATLMIHE